MRRVTRRPLHRNTFYTNELCPGDSPANLSKCSMTLVALTDEQYAHIHEAWRLFDTDEDGLITPKDLQRLLLSFGYQHTLVSPAALCARGKCAGGGRDKD